MDITPLIPKDRQVITHYGNGGFVINGVAYKGSILLMPEHVITWPITRLSEVTQELLMPLFESELPEIVLVGAGTHFAPMPTVLRDLFRAKKISSDAMDTGAACRTYSVLLAEGRQVSAALIAV